MRVGPVDDADMATPSVELVRWPEASGRRAELAAVGALRLLLVGPGDEVPLVIDDEEDWVRTPVDERDLWARIKGLQARQTVRGRTRTSCPIS